MTRVEHIGNATLYLGDCREILPRLARPDFIASDPPYGQRVNTMIETRYEADAGRYRSAGGRNVFRKTSYPKGLRGDDGPFDPSHLLEAADRVLIWGAHKFSHVLPRGRWLVWDKVPTGKVRDQGDGEMAWTNVEPDRVVRFHRRLWDGLSVAGGYETRVERVGAAAARRSHPTQKPVDLMVWCLQDIEAAGVVCDPYMGSGATGIACTLMGLPFIGIEIEPVYFDAACRRIEEAHRQGRLFAGELA